MKEQRKLAAIMFTDIVGYTAMMSKDEKKARQGLEKHRRILKSLVEQFNGEWLQAVGDSTLSSFASAVNAVACALEIQHLLIRELELKLRIGIHLGDVVFEKSEVYGDGVNVASRLEPLAAPGGICISERVYNEIQNKPEMKAVFLGEKILKNVDLPMRIYALTGKGLPVISAKEILAEKTSGLKPLPSIAVMPFTDMSPGKEEEYFCDGMAEEIINSLTQVESLHVVARTSSFAFKDRREDIREIGRKLNVGKLLEGSVRKSGNRLRITVQLINVEDGYHLWSERYDREMEDVFAIQDEISLAIVEKLKVNLLNKEKVSVAKRHTEDLDAYKLYLMGRHYWEKRSEKGLKKGLEYFRQAIDKDPSYALGYVGVADSYSALSFWGFLSPKDAFPKAKAAAKKALEINDKLAEAHASLAFVRFFYDWDWPAAECGFKQALELNPNSATARQYYAEYLLKMGRVNEALAQLQQAQEIDPLSLIIYFVFAKTYLDLGRYDEALEQSKKAIEIDPDFGPIHFFIGLLNEDKGAYKKAVPAYKKAAKLTGGLSQAGGRLGYVYGILNEREKAERILRELQAKKKERYISSYFIALVYLGLGQNDKTFEWLEKAFEERDFSLTNITYFPEFDKLHSDRRLTALLKKVGLGL
jgi:adenylate cyclase